MQGLSLKNQLIPRVGFQLLVALLLFVVGGTLSGCGSSSDDFVSTNNNNFSARNVSVDVELPEALPQGEDDFLVRLRLQSVPAATTLFTAEQEGGFGQILRFIIPNVTPGTYNVRIDILDDSGAVVSTAIRRFFVQGDTTDFIVPASSFGEPLPEGANEPTGPDTNPLGPVAVDDSYDTPGATAITRTAAEGVKANDTSDNGTVALITPPASGTLVLNADGSFTYTPTSTFSGAATFVYSLTDINGSDTATATINVEEPPPTHIFVRAGATGTGETQDDPRGDLLGALEDAGNGTTVFIFHSTQPLSLQSENTATGQNNFSYSIPSGASVIGEGSGLDDQIVPVIPAGLRPLIEGNFDMGDNTRLSGVEVTGQYPSGEDFTCVRRGSGNVVGVRVDNCLLHAQSQFGIFLITVAGDLTIEGNVFTGADSNLGGPFSLAPTNTNANLVIDNNVLCKTGNILIEGSGNNPTVSFTNNSSEEDSLLAQGLQVNIRSGSRPSVEIAHNNLATDSTNFALETFSLSVGNASVVASVHDNVLESGRFDLLTLGTDTRVSRVDVFDNDEMGCFVNCGGDTEVEFRWQRNETTVGIDASGTTSADLNAGATDTARLRALFQDNTHEHGTNFTTAGMGRLDVAVVDNQFGNPSSDVGAGRLEFNVHATGNGDVLCMKGSNTTVGSTYSFSEGDNSTFLIEELNAFIGGIDAGSDTGHSVDGDISSADPGTCQAPDPLPDPVP